MLGPRANTLIRTYALSASPRSCHTGNTEIAVLIGLYDADTYNWRSMTTPGITGLFNPNCLESAKANLITCAPGDNTYDGVQTTVRLVDPENQFHALETTEATNGEWPCLCVASFFKTNLFSPGDQEFQYLLTFGVVGRQRIYPIPA